MSTANSAKKGQSEDKDHAMDSFTSKVIMTVQSTSQVHFSSLKGKADSLLSCYQMEAIYTYECWPDISFALCLPEEIWDFSLT